VSDRGVLHDGDPVVWVDWRHRTHSAQLRVGGTTNFRGDLLPHDEAIGSADGCKVRSRRGRPFRIFRASLAQHALGMTRHAQIVYPKDIAMIVTWGDVSPGATVVEGGLGSGALTMGLLRAVGTTGRVVTYELQDSAVNRAKKNVRALLGETTNHEVRIASIYDGIGLTDVDHVVLDVPEPWEVVPHAIAALRPGGHFISYVPTVIQMQRLVQTLHDAAYFSCVECTETLLRQWHVSERSVRPMSSMIGHTGFLVFARREADDPQS
jgi:tRNA (adenine57-N1/adenine58-N1)-methyltransferase